MELEKQFNTNAITSIRNENKSLRKSIKKKSNNIVTLQKLVEVENNEMELLKIKKDEVQNSTKLLQEANKLHAKAIKIERNALRGFFFF